VFRPPAKLQALGLAQLLSAVGDRLHYLALVSLVTARAASLGIDAAPALMTLAVVMLLPTVLFAPLAGPIVDRLSLVAVLVVTDALRGVLVLLMPAVFDHAGVDLLFAAVFLLFTLNVFFLPARAAMPPRLVARDQLLAANALLAVIIVVATIAATAIGGWVVDQLGWRNALYVDGLTYLASALLLLSLAGSAPPRSTRRRAGWKVYWAEVLSGFQLLVRSTPARRSVTAWLGLWIGAGVLHVAGTLHVQDSPGEMREIGWILASLGAGVAASSLWAMRHRGIRPAIALGGGLMGAAVALALFATASELWLLCVAAGLAGLASGPLISSSETELQHASGERRRARAFAVRDFLSRLVFLVCAGISVPAVSLMGAGPALWLGAAIIGILGITLTVSLLRTRASEL
jgi:predicted MFS family arabinose efflux permease